MNKLGEGGNYVCSLVIVALLKGRGGAEVVGFKVSIRRQGRASHKGGLGNFYEGEWTPQLVYLNYLSISSSFGIKSFLSDALRNS